MEEEQQIQFKILELVDKVCRLENIKYYLAFGTLIGAIREKGFIKWDDDIDIWMLKDDYNRFSKCIGKYLDDKYFFQNIYTDKYYPLPSVSRICVNDTFKRDNSDVKFHQGIYFDIFELDPGSDKLNENIIAQKICRKIEYILGAKSGVLRNKKGSKIVLIKLLGSMLPRKLLLFLYMKIKDNLANKNGNSLICFASPYDYKKNVYSWSDFENSVELKFNGSGFYCPAGFDSLLKKIYGDYMTPQKTKPSYVVARMKD